MSEQLNPCPFCGEKVHLELFSSEGEQWEVKHCEDGKVYEVWHDNWQDEQPRCPIAYTKKYPARELAIIQWNRRVDQPTDQQPEAEGAEE